MRSGSKQGKMSLVAMVAAIGAAMAGPSGTAAAASIRKEEDRLRMMLPQYDSPGYRMTHHKWNQRAAAALRLRERVRARARKRAGR